MPARLSYTIPSPLPASLSPSTVVKALHQFEPLVTANPYLHSFRRQAVNIDEIIDDPFFREDGMQLAAFEVVERITLVPGLAHKAVAIHCVMQAFAGGVRCRSTAQGGVTVWSTWSLQARSPPAAGAAAAEATTARQLQRPQQQQPQPPRTRSGGSGSLSPDSDRNSDRSVAADWDLVEESRVECSTFVKPFVGKTFYSGHKAILKRLVDDIQTGAAGAARGSFGFGHRFA